MPNAGVFDAACEKLPPPNAAGDVAALDVCAPKAPPLLPPPNEDAPNVDVCCGELKLAEPPKMEPPEDGFVEAPPKIEPAVGDVAAERKG